jgi:hypothetical protein
VTTLTDDPLIAAMAIDRMLPLHKSSQRLRELYRQCPPAPMAAFARDEGMTLADVHETLTKETPWATT